MRKRFASSHVLLAAIGSVASVTVACDEQAPEPDEDVNVYATVEACAKQMPSNVCNGAYAAALKHHSEEAPKFTAEPDCVKEFGKCEATGTPASITTDGKTLDENGKLVSFRPVFAGFVVPSQGEGHDGAVRPLASTGGQQTVVVHDSMPMIMPMFMSYPVYHPVGGGYYSGSGMRISNDYGAARVAPAVKYIRNSPVSVPRGSSFTSTAPSFSARSIAVTRPAAAVSRGGFGSTGRASAASVGA